MHTPVDDYPPIADHGLIGDLQTAALVSTEGCIDWFCCPRFDSPSVFGSILDRRQGGAFEIAPTHAGCWVVKQLYLPDSAVLVTRFMTDQGVSELIDFMPIVESGTLASDRHRIVRLLRGVRGEMSFALKCVPRMDYGRAEQVVGITSHGAIFESRSMRLVLHGAAGATAFGNGIRLDGTVRAGQLVGFMLESGPDVHPRALTSEEMNRLLADAIHFWRRWIAGSTYHGRWREMVDRSAITLKLMTYAPSGALVAAPTTALPEQIGGGRNWDYRYTWVRDGSFSVGALLDLGFRTEAERFAGWLRERVEEHVGSASGPLKIMYRVDGSSDLYEEELPHLEGYRGSRPVRIGNGAADQLQLDIYGEALGAIHVAQHASDVMTHAGWSALTCIVDWLCDHWDQPEEGIWETRGGRQDFVYGRLMSWVAFDRAMRLARECGRPARLDRWVQARDTVYNQIIERGWNADRNSFVQYPGANVVDAALLTLPTSGFLTPRRPGLAVDTRGDRARARLR